MDRAGARETGAGTAGELVLSILRRGWRQLRTARGQLWTAAAESGDPQTRVRPRAAAGSAGVQAAQAHTAAAAAAEALQDRVHQGADTAHADRTAIAAATATGRGEDAHLRAGEETGRSARRRAPDASAHAAQQARSLLHPLQDSGDVLFSSSSSSAVL